MKVLSVLAASLGVLAGAHAAQKPENPAEAWRLLSARCQNLHHELLTVMRDGAPNPDGVNPEIDRITKLLDYLVESGELVKKEVSVSFPDGEAESGAITGFLESLDPIAENYGIFVAREMCDFGARLRLMTVAPGQPLKLTLRLPKEELKEFLEANRRLGILKE